MMTPWLDETAIVPHLCAYRERRARLGGLSVKTGCAKTCTVTAVTAALRATFAGEGPGEVPGGAGGGARGWCQSAHASLQPML
eukprot:365595-Chlamydomonas_euryale.AAC.20